MFAIPVLFTEVSSGLHGSPFRIVKFRTMTDASYANGALMPDSQRLTPFADGVFAALYTRAGPLPRGAPELTGKAQVNGSNAIRCADKFEHDLWYLEHRSLWLDVRILWLTVRRVLVCDGISAPW